MTLLKQFLPLLIGCALGVAFLAGQQINSNAVLNTDISTPTKPGAGTTKTYTKAGTFCAEGSAGTETCTGSGGGGGGFVLVEEHTASSSAELDFTTCISSTYDDYAIRLVDVLPATNGTSTLMQMSTNGGSTYDATASYWWVSWLFAGVGAGSAGGTVDTSITVGRSTYNTSGFAVSGQIDFPNPANAVINKTIYGHGFSLEAINVSTVVAEGFNLAATYVNTTAVNAFRFLAGTGNLASGTVRCYGLAK